MLKLKYLFNDVNLAEMLLKNWDNDYGVLEAVESKNGTKLVEVQTPWGEYFASVFNRVAGIQISDTDLSDLIIFSHGKALGQLHRLSSQYTPTLAKRWSYSDVLDWIQGTLIKFPSETAALLETKLLRDYFSTIPVSKSNFGLVHYDFEYDNVFYSYEFGICNVIDFDDAMYHWYVMDIEQALDSLQDCISPGEFSHKKQCFLDGYLDEYEIPDEMASIMPACRRFANLYGYVRILRSIEEQWSNEPDWLMNLRANLTVHLQEVSSDFGKEI